MLFDVQPIVTFAHFTPFQVALMKKHCWITTATQQNIQYWFILHWIHSIV